MNVSERHIKMNDTGLRIGQHFGPGGKYLLESLERALDVPASAMQIFAGNPHRYWGSKTDEDVAATWREYSSHMYKVVHANYLTNIGERPDVRGAKMTRHSLVNLLDICRASGELCRYLGEVDA